MLLKKLFFPVFVVVTLASCKSGVQEKKSTDSVITKHPDWIMQGNIYEVNVRQYTPEGTFAAFEKNLQRLKDMGVQTLWFMPINPIGVVDRKGSLGSYYAVKDYTAINPEFGNLENWKSLVKTAHAMGFKVIIDWVANHTSADHAWLTTHPDFYVKDSASGKPLSPFDWTDARKLNFKNTAMQDSMIASMKYWLTATDIDGFRCDVAGEVPDSFWKRCITTLRKEKDIFMLAEGDRKGLHESGFDATYGWNDFNMMKMIAKGERKAKDIDSAFAKSDTLYPKDALRMFFTSNHDENSWNKADYATMPGASHAPFAVLTQTIAHTAPLIYSGQEEPCLRTIKFFDKDTIKFGTFARAKFYKTLLNLRTKNPALSADASFKKVVVSNEDNVYAFTREKDGKKILVILNLSKNPETIVVKDKALHGKPYNTFMYMNEELTDKPWKLEQWGYVIYEY